MAVEFGIFSNGNRIFRPQADAWDEDLWEIGLADQLGFQEAWISEHATLAELILCRAAAETKHIKLGTGVVSLPYHNPLWAVERIVLLDHLTRTRISDTTAPSPLSCDGRSPPPGRGARCRLRRRAASPGS